MTYIINKEIEFDAGHRVPLHASKCKNPHGHRYRVVIYIHGDLIQEGPESGMVRDFGNLKQILTERVHDVFDHGMIVHSQDHEFLRRLGVSYDPDHGDYTSPNGWKIIVVDYIPTAECLAKAIHDDLKKNGLPNLLEVQVWETPTSCATFVSPNT